MCVETAAGRANAVQLKTIKHLPVRDHIRPTTYQQVTTTKKDLASLYFIKNMKLISDSLSIYSFLSGSPYSLQLLYVQSVPCQLQKLEAPTQVSWRLPSLTHPLLARSLSAMLFPYPDDGFNCAQSGIQ